MEALNRVSVAALTVYDMCKRYERGMRTRAFGWWRSRAGRSGDYRAD